MATNQRLKLIRQHLENFYRQVSSLPSAVSSTISHVDSIIQSKARMRVPEVSSSDLMREYLGMTEADKHTFLKHLSLNYQCAEQVINQNIGALQATQSDARIKLQQKLRESLSPHYEVIFREIGSVDGGVKFLVDLRSELISLIRQTTSSEEHAALQVMNNSLKQLLGLWFGVGFLSLERITWQSPCDLLEKIMAYEGVHPVRNVSDLRMRVGLYRRCFTFIHPSMPREPVVILHIALTNSISTNIQSIVQHPTLSDKQQFSQLQDHLQERTDMFNSAIFYSITSTQPGLQGIDLGNYLIKRVVKGLLIEFPQLTNFSSLSPIPGFRDWLNTALTQEIRGHRTALLSDSQTSHLASSLRVDKDLVPNKLKSLLANGEWARSEELCLTLKPVLLSLCARYLCVEKRRGFALNSVANFHLRNGATLWRINYLGNTTAKGLMESCGLMVNYRYYLDKTESNSVQYLDNHSMDIDKQVLDLLDS